MFQKRYRDRDGRVCKTTNYYIEYAVNGRMKRESTEFAGVPRSTAMAMVGHKTESIYKRYSIQDSVMLAAGASKLDSLHRSQELEAKKKFRRPARQRKA